MRGRRAALGAAAFIAFAGVLGTAATGARADTCWNHNGSLMRLQAEGPARMIYYEQPRRALRNVGVRPGDLFFDGRKSGDFYVGRARVFNGDCLDRPQEYRVGGPVRPDQLQIVMEGRREIYRDCAPTGRSRMDRLILTYERQC